MPKHISHIVPFVENMAVTADELRCDILVAIELSKKEMRTVHISYAGMFDVMVYPSGNFQLIPLQSFKLYKLSVGGNHCKEVVL